MAKPGVMFYFDIRPCLKRLSAEEKGLLFDAILEYGEHGSEPEFSGAVGVAWDFIKPGIDRDSDRYGNQVLQRQHATYSREAKKRNLIPICFDEWKLLSDNERKRLISGDTGRYPTTTTTPTTTSATTIECKADKSPRTRFSPPSVDAVKAYIEENNYIVDAQRFVDYYTANGWKVGKNPMKDWKAAVRTWHRKDNTDNGKTEPEPIRTYGTEL